MPLPQRPSTYLLTALLLVLIALVAYLAVTITSPELQAAIQKAKERKAAEGESAH